MVPQDNFERRRRMFHRLVDRYRWCVERSADADGGERIVIHRVERVAGCLEVAPERLRGLVP